MRQKSDTQEVDEAEWTSEEEDENDLTKGMDSPAASPKKPRSANSRGSTASRSSAASRESATSHDTAVVSRSSRSAPPPPDVTSHTPSPTKRTSSSSSKTASSSIHPPQRQPSLHSISTSVHSQSSVSINRRGDDGHSHAANGGTETSAGRRRRRKLQWKKSVRVNVIPNLSYFSQQEKLLTWYQPEEYSLMEDECDLTSECLDAKKPLWPGFCGRGLESWTLEGEQRKEQHVQLAIDIVWQAQLDQWRQASNTDECWEFIRSQYLQVSKPCLRLAKETAESDERDVQAYLSSVRALERSRRKMLGIRGRSTTTGSKRVIRRGRINRTISDTSGYVVSSPNDDDDHEERISPRRSLSDVRSPRRSLSDMPSTPTRPILRSAMKPDWDQTPKSGSRKVKSRSAGGIDTIRMVSEDTTLEGSNEDDDDETDGSSTLASSIVEAYSKKKKLANKKIEFKPKSKTKVPTSPVGSVAKSVDTSDSNSMIRRMRSHLSVASDDSTRRRMMRTAAMKAPL